MARIKDLTITDYSYDALGIAFEQDHVYLVPGVIENEKVKVLIDDDTKKVCQCKVKEILSSSPDRQEPPCKYYSLCGGCNMMHIAYPKTLEIKKKFICETMHKISHMDVDVKDVCGLEYPFRYRNKLQFPVSYNNGLINIGYYKRKTHNVISIDDCLLQSENVSRILVFLEQLLNKENFSIYNEKNQKGILRHIIIRENEIGEVLVIFVCNIKEDKIKNTFKVIKEKLIEQFSFIKGIIIDQNTKAGNVILGNKKTLIYGVDSLTYSLLGVKYNISYNSFFQVNKEVVKSLYNEVLRLANLTGKENVIDAYCGVGSISLQLAKGAKKVIGIEIVPEAIENAKANAKLNGIENVSFILGKVEDKINEVLDDNIDLIVFDPPRKGLDSSIIQMLKETNIKRIIYVSCNYATLARDIDLLRDEYEVSNMSAFDMFAWSSEVESVCLLTNRTGNTK